MNKPKVHLRKWQEIALWICAILAESMVSAALINYALSSSTGNGMMTAITLVVGIGCGFGAFYTFVHFVVQEVE